MEKYYTLKLGPLTRKLPLIAVDKNILIASFVLLGDGQLAYYSANRLKRYLKGIDFDYLVTSETKGIPLAEELCIQTNHLKYIVLRKSIKAYMKDPVTLAVKSITTKGSQKLVLNGSDVDLIKNKKVVLVDDVVSTGGTIDSSRKLIEKVGGKVVKQLTILAEGQGKKRKDVDFLSSIPMFKKEGDSLREI